MFKCSNSYSRYLCSNTLIIRNIFTIFLLCYVVIISIEVSINYIAKLYHENTHFIIHQRISKVNVFFLVARSLKQRALHSRLPTRTCIYTHVYSRLARRAQGRFPLFSTAGSFNERERRDPHKFVVRWLKSQLLWLATIRRHFCARFTFRSSANF